MYYVLDFYAADTLVNVLYESGWHEWSESLYTNLHILPMYTDTHKHTLVNFERDVSAYIFIVGGPHDNHSPEASKEGGLLKVLHAVTSRYLWQKLLDFDHLNNVL